jgi:hypothetical protein
MSLGVLGGMLMLLAFAVEATPAAAANRCTLRVDRSSATAGSSFTFVGSGFSPTQLTLQKAGEPPTVHAVDVANADPWRITVASRVGDEGRWAATFSEPGGCTEQVSFRVTLRNTATAGELVAGASAPDSSAPALLLLVALGFAGGALAGRRVQQAVRA